MYHVRYAISYAADHNIWIQEFSRVYYKMLHHGYSQLINVRSSV